MKKSFLLSMLVISAASLYGQTISYGIDAGLNLTKLSFTSYSPAGSGISIPVSNSYLTGFHAGGLVDIGFGSFSIQPGVLFSTKGGNSSFSFSDVIFGQTFTASSKVKTTLDYVEAPLNFIYRMDVGDGNIFIGAGPYLGIGISGKSVANSITNGTPSTTTQDLKFGSGTNDIKNPDFGVNGLLGYQLNLGLSISAGYGLGLVSSSGSNGSGKNQGFSFSLAYFLSSGKHKFIRNPVF
jgi:hypothetical protein